MRNFYGLIFLAGALVIVGCGKEQTSSTSSSPAPSASPPSGGDGYLGALAKGHEVAVKGIDTASLNQAVQLFNAQEGRFPTDLSELVTKQYLGKLPDAPAGMKLNYDATQGKVTVVPQ
jgi:hypothetical protein